MKKSKQPPALRLRWRTIARNHLPGAAHHASQDKLSGDPAYPLHTHDYAEVFLVVEGRGEHLLPWGAHPLAPGDLWLMRPSDQHGFRTTPGETIVLHNVPFESSALASLRRRYWPGRSSPYGEEAERPQGITLRGRRLARARDAFERMVESRHRTAACRDAFLLNLLNEIEQPDLQPAHASAPHWLNRLLNQLEDRETLLGGTRALAVRAGCSPEHLSRVVRRHLGRTPSALLNDARFAHAARELALTERKVIEIAFDCGFTHLAHFYAEFRRRHGMPPGAYRARRRAFPPPQTAGVAKEPTT